MPLRAPLPASGAAMRLQLLAALSVLLCLASVGGGQAANSFVGYMKTVARVVEEFFKFGGNPAEYWDWYLLDLIPGLLGSPPCNENGTLESPERLKLDDEHNNDNLSSSTVQDIIRSSGFQYQNYDSLSDDGYTTVIVRLINPLADRRRLRKPPVLLFHGGVVDPTLFVWASPRQHHPEPWPREPRHGPFSSWNRSLAFMLANNGYDVWLAGTRGSDMQNMHRSFRLGLEGLTDNDNMVKNMTSGELEGQLTRSLRFWPYTMDEIIAHEIPRQLERVAEVTGSKKLSVLTYSFSTMTSLPLMSIKPHIAESLVHNFILMAPIINNKDSNIVVKLFCRDYAMIRPEILGEFLNMKLLLTPLTRMYANVLDKHRTKYTLLKLLTTLFSGSSAKYQTLLEPAVVGHSLMPTSFKQMQHYCQQVRKSRLQKFDYGRLLNMFIYGSLRPPVYNISKIPLNNWMLISGATDNLAPPSSVRQILRELSSKPNVNINVPGYNHLDLLAAYDNDIKVNLPILEFLNSHTLP